ncbi:MAG: hypothetical protein BAJALOKI1v1_340002 [Promethearchaeota archaeon]|nr:MAG: hypothetical protein BAJALOKI1v1_340002 [Candidatus Lokiarchaeota archaeon]
MEKEILEISQNTSFCFRGAIDISRISFENGLRDDLYSLIIDEYIGLLFNQFIISIVHLSDIKTYKLRRCRDFW